MNHGLNNLKDSQKLPISIFSVMLGFLIFTDTSGRHLPVYLAQLSGFNLSEQAATARELDSLEKNAGHIKEIMARQQSYATDSQTDGAESRWPERPKPDFGGRQWSRIFAGEHDANLQSRIHDPDVGTRFRFA